MFFQIPSDFKTSEFASMRQRDNLSLRDAQYLVRVIKALNLGDREILIGWNFSTNSSRILVEDFLAQGGDSNVPIEIYIRHQKEISTGDSLGSQSVVGQGTLAAKYATDMNAGVWNLYRSAVQPLLGSDKSDGAVLSYATTNLTSMYDVVGSALREIVSRVPRQ